MSAMRFSIWENSVERASSSSLSCAVAPSLSARFLSAMPITQYRTIASTAKATSAQTPTPPTVRPDMPKRDCASLTLPALLRWWGDGGHGVATFAGGAARMDFSRSFERGGQRAALVDVIVRAVLSKLETEAPALEFINAAPSLSAPK